MALATLLATAVAVAPRQRTALAPDQEPPHASVHIADEAESPVVSGTEQSPPTEAVAPEVPVAEATSIGDLWVGDEDGDVSAHVKFYPVPPQLPLLRNDDLARGQGRPYLPTFVASSVRFTPPVPTVNGDLSTLDSVVQGWDAPSASYREEGPGINLVQTKARFRFVVEQEVVNTYSMAAVTRAIEQFNAVPGSRFRASIAETTATGIVAPVEDGVWRIFFDDATCRSGDLAWSHMQRAEYDTVYGGRQIAVGELDIGLCRSLSSKTFDSTIGHELLHGAGMSHLCNQGERCFKAGMASSNSCRIMYPAARSCQSFNEADTRAMGYLHPMVPRMSGPTREQTAARASYALRGRGSADEVVFVDGSRSPDLAIQAAAFAAAIDAPLLLTAMDVPCTQGEAATELNRVATDDATVWLVGPMPPMCSMDLSDWDLASSALPDGAVIADAIMRIGETAASSRTLLVTRGAVNGDSPDALAAAAVAGRLKGPILYSQGSKLTTQASQWLASQGGAGLARAIVVGGPQAVPDAVVQQLRSQGLDVLRLSGPSRIDTALALARHDAAFGPSRAKVLIAAADRWPDTVTASAVGGAFGWPVVLVGRDAVSASVVDYLRSTSAAAVIVGGPGVISDATQYALSRTVRTLP